MRTSSSCLPKFSLIGEDAKNSVRVRPLVEAGVLVVRGEAMWTDGPVSSAARSNSRLIPPIGAKVEIGALGNAGAVRIDATAVDSHPQLYADAGRVLRGGGVLRFRATRRRGR